MCIVPRGLTRFNSLPRILFFSPDSTRALNGAVMSLARIPFAMARDGLFFSGLGEVTEKSHVPVWSIIARGAWASVVALSGTFDQITTCAILAVFKFPR